MNLVTIDTDTGEVISPGSYQNDFNLYLNGVMKDMEMRFKRQMLMNMLNIISNNLRL